MYDDRGLDVVANSVDKLIPIYKQYSEWVLPYDKKEIISKLGL
ncbi:DUF3885 domain-containing protein [Listeria rocourtiae]